MAQSEPPTGSELASPYAQRVEIEKYLGPTFPDKTDPGFLPPTDPTKDGDIRQRARLVYREIPLVTIQNTWTVHLAREALFAHTQGIFEMPGQLVEAILGDDRVQATIGSRIGGLFGQEIKHRAADDSDRAKECLKAWKDAWPCIAPQAELDTLDTFGIMMGFSTAQTVWNTTGPIWYPQLMFWHPRFVYYHWPLRRYVAISLDGQYPIIPGDGKWFLYAPHGEYRGWMRGAMRAVTEPWLIRHFAYRDWARFSEVHGMPIRKGIVPAASDPQERSIFQQQLSALGNETTIMVPSGVDGINGYDLQLLEATDTAWESFPGLIDRCDMSIVLAILFQNLTTEVKEGSYAAARVHSDVRQGALQADNKSLSMAIYHQLARPFAEINFGNPELAPFTEWNVQPTEDFHTNADLFQKFGTAVEVLRRGGVQFSDADAVRKFARDEFGISLPAIEFKDPVSSGLGGK